MSSVSANLYCLECPSYCEDIAKYNPCVPPHQSNFPLSRKRSLNDKTRDDIHLCRTYNKKCPFIPLTESELIDLELRLDENLIGKYFEIIKRKIKNLNTCCQVCNTHPLEIEELKRMCSKCTSGECSCIFRDDTSVCIVEIVNTNNKLKFIQLVSSLISDKESYSPSQVRTFKICLFVFLALGPSNSPPLFQFERNLLLFNFPKDYMKAIKLQEKKSKKYLHAFYDNSAVYQHMIDRLSYAVQNELDL